MSTEFYNLDQYDNGSIKLWSNRIKAEVYRFKYKTIREKSSVNPPVKNNFIVYILYQSRVEDKGLIYVGKSKNGMKDRPTSHEDISTDWEYCYVLTESGTLFNDGSIHYIEDRIFEKARETNRFQLETSQTTKDTINSRDKRSIDPYLEDFIGMLEVLGLDLTTSHQEGSNDKEQLQKRIQLLDNDNLELRRRLRLQGEQEADLKEQLVKMQEGKKVVEEELKRKEIEIGKIEEENSELRKNIGLLKEQKELLEVQLKEFQEKQKVTEVLQKVGKGVEEDPRHICDSSHVISEGEGTFRYHVVLKDNKVKDRKAEGIFDFRDNSLTLFKGSQLAPIDTYLEQRKVGTPYKKYKEYIANGLVSKEGIVLQDMRFNGPSQATILYGGGYGDCWHACYVDDGRTLFQVREDLGLGLKGDISGPDSTSGLDGRTKYHVTLVGKGYEKVRHAEGTYDFATNTFILLAGAELCPEELCTDSFWGLHAYKSLKRSIDLGEVVDAVTTKDLKFKGPSTPSSWYLGRSTNGFTSCIADDGRTLMKIREELGMSSKW